MTVLNIQEKSYADLKQLAIAARDKGFIPLGFRCNKKKALLIEAINEAIAKGYRLPRETRKVKLSRNRPSKAMLSILALYGC